jgi:hypothetical protein
MSELPELQNSSHWRMAVWSLRAGYLGLVVALAGLVALVFGSTPWILAVGVIIWLATVPVTLTGFLWARREVPEPRPRLWSMRLMLIHDSVHAVPSA